MSDSESSSMEVETSVPTKNEKADCGVSLRARNENGSVKYNLRDSSIITRIQSERRRTVPKQPKPKSKPPPLSKYRRKSANARERDRMKMMNDAFEELKKVVPDYTSVCKTGKVTKMTTLRLAVNYIAALRAVLGYEDEQSLPPNDLDSVGDSGSSEGGSEAESCRSPSSDTLDFSLSEHDLSDIGNGFNFSDLDLKNDFDDIVD